ncbi:uncharacterized protein LOC115200622 isoform X3 [Salmo trutta]|uniref:uncharacterized protein LOC115200622 isoform X3 n=1 Tax=Salmo trutta TaxID=8032 RepID=UPI00113116F5|nr:uncharacterized protein LOC115200622 isoform X3 [Salmo trutta]
MSSSQETEEDEGGVESSPQSVQSAASPAPSYLSMKSDHSMGPPINFRDRVLDGKFSPQSVQSAASPAPSCLSMKSDQSMGQPINFRDRVLDGEFRAKQRKMSASTSYSHSSWRGITDHPCTFNGRPYHCPQSVQSAASPTPSYLSMKSDQSMGPPINFRDRVLDGEFSALTASLLAEDHFRCSVCKEVLNEPVSFPCGHSFCRQCIETYWNKPAKKKVYDCPGCQRRYMTCPVLFTNLTLDKVIQKLQQTGFKVPALPPHRYAGPGDVACDLCTEKQLKAVKFCLTCTASYCESHVRQHYTVAALQRHTLVDATGNLDQKLCNEEQQTALRLEAKLEQMNTEFAEEKTQKNKLTQNVKNPTTELTCYAKRSSKDWATECFVLAALGRPLDLGMMYDCCSDCLSSDVGLWDESTTANMRQSLPRPHTEVMCIEGDSLQDRFRALNVSTSLRASVLSGLVEVDGAAGYLNHPAQSKNKDRVTLQYRTTTRLDMLSHRVFEETVKRDSKATHVVMAVLYGAQAFFIFDDKRVSGEKRAGGGEVDMRSVIKKMAPSFSADHMLSSLSDNEKINSLLYQCTLHSDVDYINGSMTYGQAVQALESLPKHLGQQGEKAVPLYAWLYPLKNLVTSVQITQGFLSEVEDVVEHLRQVIMRCQAMMTLLHVNDDVMKRFPSVKEKLAEFSELLQKYQSEFKRGLAMAVKTVRESEEMDEKRLRDILQNHDQSPFCSQYTHQWLNNKKEEIKALLICKAKNIPIGKEVQEKAKNIPTGKEVQEKAKNIPTGKEVQEKAKNIPTGKEVQEKAKNIPTGKEVQEKAKNIPTGKEVQEKAKNIPTGKEVPTPNRTLCFTLTSLVGEDPYLSTMKRYIHSALEITTNQSGISGQQQTQHAFKPPDLTEKIQSDLHLFTTSNEDRRDGEKFNFLVAAIPDVTFPGSRIGLYQNGRLIGRNFKLGSKPNPAEVTEIKQNSFNLKFPQSKVMSPVKYRIEYTAESDVQWTVRYLPSGPGSVGLGPDHCNTCMLPGLKPDTKYQVRYSAVDRSSMSDFSMVTMVKTNPRSTPGQPCVKLVGENVRVTWRIAEEEDGVPVLRYAVEFKEAGLEGWSRVSTTGPECRCTLSQTSSTCYRVRVSAVYGEGDTSKPSTETDIPVKVWSIDLSQRKASFLLDVLKLQPEKKPVELKGWSDEESEVRSFLQCLPYISQLRFVNNNSNAAVIQFVLNLSVAAADHEARTGWSWSKFLSLVWSYSSFPFNEEVHPSDQCDFLLDLYSCAKASGTKKGRSLIPLLRPVYQSAPAVWYVNLARRKASVFLEVLKLQPVKRPVQVKCWSDEESEVKSFLQCLPYISQLSFKDNNLVHFLHKNREQAQHFAALLQAHGFTLSLGGELPRQTCTSVGRILALCASGVKLGLTPCKISLRGASILFRHPLMLHNLILNEIMTVKLTRLLATGRVSAPMGVEELSLVVENSQLSEDMLSRVLSSVASLLRLWAVQCLDLTECTIHGHSLILLLGHQGPLKLKLCPDTLQQLAVVVHEAQDKDLTHSFLKKVGGDLTSCRLDWEVLLSLLQRSTHNITVNLRENWLSKRNITDLRPFLGRIILKSVDRNLLLLFLHCYSASKIQPGATALLGALQHRLDFSSSVDLSTKDQGKPLCLSSADCKAIVRVLEQSRCVTELILCDCEISDRALTKLLLKIPRRVNLSPSKAILVQLVQTCNKNNAVHHAGSLVRALGGELDLSETKLDQKACRSLALVLMHSKGLSELDLSRCQLTDHHLQPLLTHLHKVQVLDLSHNAISNYLSKKILKAVSTSKGHIVRLTNNRMKAKPLF